MRVIRRFIACALAGGCMLAAVGCQHLAEGAETTGERDSLAVTEIGTQKETVETEKVTDTEPMQTDAQETETEPETKALEKKTFVLRVSIQPPEEELALPVKSFDSLEAACKEADKGQYYARGYAVYSEDGQFLYGHYNQFVTELLSHAKHVADFIKANQYTYGDAATNPGLTYRRYKKTGRLTEKVVSCDRFVAWVLYEMGYTDQPSQTGLVVWSNGSANDLGAYLEKKGFAKITDASDVQAGDIVLVNPATTASGTVYPSHVFLCAGETRSPAHYFRYDAGCANRLRCEAVPGKGGDYSSYSTSGQPFVEPINNFMFAYRYVEGQTERPGVD